jgi:hypothetical protein
MEGYRAKEEWVRRKQINKNSILKSHPLTPGWLATNVNGVGAVCDQKTSKFFVPQGRIHDKDM